MKSRQRTKSVLCVMLAALCLLLVMCSNSSQERDITPVGSQEEGRDSAAGDPGKDPTRQELEALADGAHVRVIHVLTRPSDWAGPTGRLDGAMLAELLTAGDRKAAALVCGPPAMMTATVAALRACRFPRRRIFTERFAL